MFYAKPNALETAFYLVGNSADRHHLVDDAGNTIAVDTVNGIIYKNGRPVGASSVKRNGYLYVNTSIETMRDGMTNVMIGCHCLVNMCSDISNFMKLGIVPCHRNNCPWDNRASNLEWGTTRDNARHSRIVEGLHKEFPNIFTFEDRGHVILKKPILNEWVHEYLALTEANYFAVERGLTVDVRKLVYFVDWLEKRHYW